MKQKVYAYLVRGGKELLVFDHVDFPEAGTQVPGGSLDPGESIEEGVLRELFEETGIGGGPSVASASVAPQARWGARPVRYLGAFPWWFEAQGIWHERHVYHLEPTAELPDEWIHTVSSGTEDRGLRFRCYWIPLAEARDRLCAQMGDYWPE